MIYLLDTNACIHYLNVRDSAVARKLATLQPTDVAVCSIVKAELFYRAQRSSGSRKEQYLANGGDRLQTICTQKWQKRL